MGYLSSIFVIEPSYVASTKRDPKKIFKDFYKTSIPHLKVAVQLPALNPISEKFTFDATHMFLREMAVKLSEDYHVFPIENQAAWDKSIATTIAGKMISGEITESESYRLSFHADVSRQLVGSSRGYTGPVPQMQQFVKWEQIMKQAVDLQDRLKTKRAITKTLKQANNTRWENIEHALASGTVDAALLTSEFAYRVVSRFPNAKLRVYK